MQDAGKVTATDKERIAGDAYARALGGSSATFEKLGTLLDEDAHFSFAGMRDVHGRDHIQKAHGALLGTVDDRTFTPTRTLLTDSSQVVEWTMTGVHKSTRKTVVFRGATLLWTKDDGSISDIHLYFDEAVLKAQVGVGPKGLVAPPPQPDVSKLPHQDVEQLILPEEQANVDLVRASLEALETNQDSAYLATMTDDVEVVGLEGKEPARGKADARAYFKTMRKAIDQLDTSVDDAWGIGAFVVVEYHIIGEQRGALGWIPAQKDTLIKMSIVDVVLMRDGKIARVWRYDNPAQILAMPEVSGEKTR